MRYFEDRLRNDLRRTGTVVTVSTETMLGRVARARRRRSATAGVGAAAAAVLVLTIAVAALSGRVGGEAANAGPRLEHRVQLINLLFTDERHGYAVQERCSEPRMDGVVRWTAPSDPFQAPDLQRECTSLLLATADAGQTWQERPLPGQMPKESGVDFLLGHSLMFWSPAPGTIALEGRDSRFWTSSDGGVTWTESPVPREIGPPGSYRMLGLDDRPVLLATSPPNAEQGRDKNPVIAASDGSFWLACVTSNCVRVTHDLGRTWEVHTIGPAAHAADWVATADGQTVFALVPDGADSILLRSADAGVDWQQVPGVVLAWRGADALALPNGDLIMTRSGEAGGVFRLRAGTTTVEQLAGAPTHPTSLYRTGGWLVATTGFADSEQPDVPPVAWISRDDGTSWIAVPSS